MQIHINYSKIFTETEENIVIEINPFTQCILDHLYAAKLLKEKSMAALESYMEEDILEVPAEPEQLLGFDSSCCPEGVYFLISLPETKLDGYHTSFSMKRIGDKLCFDFTAHSEDVSGTSPYDPVNVMLKMMEASKGTALSCDDQICDLDGDSWTSFFYVHRGGNMYKAYMDAFAVLEKVYHKALEELKRKAKPVF